MRGGGVAVLQEYVYVYHLMFPYVSHGRSCIVCAHDIANSPDAAWQTVTVRVPLAISATQSYVLPVRMQ